MLYKNAITDETYKLLIEIMNDDKFKDFILVGGTALSLQIGHRKSIDLDLFTIKDIDSEDFCNYLTHKYNFIESYQEKNTLKGFINEILIDCIKYNYLDVKNINIIDNIRLASFEDIITMKLIAIYQDGTRMKDFIDIAYLSEYYSLNEMIRICNNKTNNSKELSIMKGLIYFDDIIYTTTINMIDPKYSFDKVKKRLIDMVNYPDYKFDKMD